VPIPDEKLLPLCRLETVELAFFKSNHMLKKNNNIRLIILIY